LGGDCAGIELDLAKKVVKLKEKIVFKSGTAKILPESHGLVDQIAHALKIIHEILDKDGSEIGLEQINYLVGGHTHRNAGVKQDNPKAVQRSEQRACAVRRKLMAAGVPTSIIFAKGLGGGMPISDKAHDNRRVEITVVSQLRARILAEEAVARAAKAGPIKKATPKKKDSSRKKKTSDKKKKTGFGFKKKSPKRSKNKNKIKK